MSRYSFSLLHITERSACDTSNGSTRICGSWNQHPILASCKATSDLVWRRRVFQNSNRVVTENHLARAPTVARESKKIFVFFSVDLLPANTALLPLVNAANEHNKRYVRVSVLVPCLDLQSIE
ncbi:hypothetical protein J3E68DRAFT_326978 [Trichoderma sp. SZMC 28012]